MKAKGSAEENAKASANGFHDDPFVMAATGGAKPSQKREATAKRSKPLQNVGRKQSHDPFMSNPIGNVVPSVDPFGSQRPSVTTAVDPFASKARGTNADPFAQVAPQRPAPLNTKTAAVMNLSPKYTDNASLADIFEDQVRFFWSQRERRLTI